MFLPVIADSVPRMACHTTNMPVKALELWDPVAVTAVANTGLVDNETFPANSTGNWSFTLL